jgi:general secretion pathway protein M
MLVALRVASAGAVTLVEKMPFGNSLYFAFVTGLTIGYGDIVVKTSFGRLVALLIGFDGILFTGLMVAALVVSLGLYYALLIDPALTGRQRLNRNLPVLRQQVAQMQAMAKEATSLSGKSSTPQIPFSKENIEAALARNGLKAQNVMLTGDFAKLQLAAVSFSGTLNWVDEMQRTTLLSVTEANIVALTQPDMVNATIMLHRTGND